MVMVICLTMPGCFDMAPGGGEVKAAESIKLYVLVEVQPFRIPNYLQKYWAVITGY